MPSLQVIKSKSSKNLNLDDTDYFFDNFDKLIKVNYTCMFNKNQPTLIKKTLLNAFDQVNEVNPRPKLTNSRMASRSIQHQQPYSFRDLNGF